MFTPKAYYFLYYGASAMVLPYLVIHYESLGMSGSQIGILAALLPLFTWLGAPFWSSVADSSNRHQAVFYIAILGSSLAVAFLLQVDAFLGLLLLITMLAFFNSPIIPLLDNTIMDMLGQHKERYGKVRFWGSVGWGITATLAGVLIDRNGMDMAFYGYLIFMAFGLIVALWLPLSHSGMNQGFWSGVRNFAFDPRWLVFLGFTFVAGLCMAIVNFYLFLHLNQLGASKSLMGLSVTVAIISELPVLFFAGGLLNRWGIRGLLSVSLIVFGLRSILISLITLPWLILPIQAMHGLTYATIWMAGVTFANQNAPDGMGATGQGLFTGVFLGFGAVAGALLGGALYEQIGGAATFLWIGVGTISSLAVLTLIWNRVFPKTS